jgi:hypothetical protein
MNAGEAPAWHSLTAQEAVERLTGNVTEKAIIRAMRPREAALEAAAPA